jgi:2-dehydro-3-deoxygalactonokinase
VRGGRLESFSTSMTGEFYAVLRQHSILSRTMAPDDGEFDETVFHEAVERARRGDDVLHTAFGARTLALFGHLAAHQVPSYLSGLLIGEELRARRMQEADAPVILVGAQSLTRRYGLALEWLGMQVRVAGQEATWMGLAAIHELLEGPR